MEFELRCLTLVSRHWMTLMAGALYFVGINGKSFILFLVVGVIADFTRTHASPPRRTWMPLPAG